MSSAYSAATAPKRAIPRVPPPLHSSAHARSPSRQRVGRACSLCRSRKVKCDGKRPSCRGCRQHGVECVYATSRKDKLKEAAKTNERLVGLLKRVRDHVEEGQQKEIDDIIEDMADELAAAAVSTEGQPKLVPTEPEFDDEPAETNNFSELGSDDDSNILYEDLLDTSLATGFLGKNSDIQLMRRLHHQVNQPLAGSTYGDDPGSARMSAATSRKSSDESVAKKQTNHYYFYLDDQKVHLEGHINPYELPPFEVAERLLQCYISTVQNTFPILEKMQFIAEFYHLYRVIAEGTPFTLSDKSQTILNMVFAIGAVYSHLDGTEWWADVRDHLIYHSRAWTLALKDPWWYSHPSLFQLQLTGLLSLYYLAIGHVNRSWTLSGMAIRSGYALGLHLRVEDPAVTAVKRELRARIWWGVFSLDIALSTITGRAPSGLERYCSVPQPLPLAAEELEESRVQSARADAVPSYHDSNPSTPLTDGANCGSYLRNIVMVNLVISTALNDLYSPNPANKSWEAVQKNVAQLLERLESWVLQLPPGLHFLSPSMTTPCPQERTTVALHYYSAQILISRPSLLRIDIHTSKQTDGSDELSRRTAGICVDAAKAIAALLPVDADRVGIRAWHLAPWWSMVHFLMQAVATLLLNISNLASDLSYDPSELQALKKLLRCLRVMGLKNASANRAYTIGFGLLKRLAQPFPVAIFDLLSEDLAHSSTNVPYQQDDPFLTPYSQDYSQELNPAPPANMYASYVDGGHGMYHSNYMGWSAGGPSHGFTDVKDGATDAQNAFPNMFVTTYDERNPLPDQVPGVSMQGQFDPQFTQPEQRMQ